MNQKIIEIVKDIGNRLADPDRVSVMENTVNGFKNEDILSLAGGCPGVLLLFCELARHFPGESWELFADRYFAKIQGSVSTVGFDNLSLFCGAAGIGMAVRIFSQMDTQEREKQTELLGFVQECLLKALPKEISFCLSKLGDVEAQDYDVVNGLSGIGRYLCFFKEEPVVKSLLEGVLYYLVNLTDDIEAESQMVPGWYISAANRLNRENNAYPNGYFDCGLSHGITGPLALLSISLLHGIEVKGQREAIQKIAHWLAEWKDEAGYWACLVGFEEYVDGEKMRMNSRDAWCYGAPGVARVLWLAGSALDDLQLKNMAIETFDAIFTRPEQTWKAISPTFCHGIAGLMQLANCMYQDTQLERFAGYRESLASRIIEYYQGEAPLGFYNIMDDSGRKLSKAGLLDGSAGIALAMLALVKPIKTDWDVVFLIK